MSREPQGGSWGVGEVSEARRLFSALPGYPFLPCPICKGTDGCDHTVRERAQATHPGLVLDKPQGVLS